MKTRTPVRFAALAGLVLAAGCFDASITPPPEASGASVPASPQALRQLFDRVSPEVMALPQTVFAARDEGTGQLVFGVERAEAGRGVQTVLARLGVPAGSYRIEVTEPIRAMSTTLRTEHRPTVGGIQIHFSSWVCTLGFNVDHAGGRSFITNSHCTDVQGSADGTQYFQPVSSTSPTRIAVEADDPPYLAAPTFAGCSSGKVCRYSDAARALYESATTSTQGSIARTTGVNTGSLTVAGAFTVTAQDANSITFSGTLHKVGRTTGWTSGTVTYTCITVNVSGSNVQLHCQTMVQRRGTQIVQGGDSGSPVFVDTGNGNATLVGILWGGSTNGQQFVMSPLHYVQRELGAFSAIGSGSNNDDSGGDEPSCPPNSKSPKCR